jgi:hypothetical protein
VTLAAGESRIQSLHLKRIAAMVQRVLSGVAVGLVFLGAAFSQEPVKVEVHFETKHVPPGLKAGDRVNLVRLNSSTVIKGKELYNTTPVANDLEVISVTPMEKPKEPYLAVKVELGATKEQAEKIERLKKATVAISTTDGQGVVVTRRVPVPLRLEMTQPGKK